MTLLKKNPFPHAGPPPSTGDSNGVPKEEAPFTVNNQTGMIMHDRMCYGNPI